MIPREDPEDERDRVRERRRTELDRAKTAQETAGDLTSDRRNVYGNVSLMNFLPGRIPGYRGGKGANLK